MSEAEILFEVKDGLGLITLNRPKALNALTHGMILELERVIPDWEKNPAVKAVVVDWVRGVCGSGPGKWVEVDSGWDRCFVGERGVGLERFEEPLEGKRDLLEGFIVY